MKVHFSTLMNKISPKTKIIIGSLAVGAATLAGLNQLSKSETQYLEAENEINKELIDRMELLSRISNPLGETPEKNMQNFINSSISNNIEYYTTAEKNATEYLHYLRSNSAIDNYHNIQDYYDNVGYDIELAKKDSTRASDNKAFFEKMKDYKETLENPKANPLEKTVAKAGLEHGLEEEENHEKLYYEYKFYDNPDYYEKYCMYEYK